MSIRSPKPTSIGEAFKDASLRDILSDIPLPFGTPIDETLKHLMEIYQDSEWWNKTDNYRYLKHRIPLSERFQIM